MYLENNNPDSNWKTFSFKYDVTLSVGLVYAIFPKNSDVVRSCTHVMIVLICLFFVCSFGDRCFSTFALHLSNNTFYCEH